MSASKDKEYVITWAGKRRHRMGEPGLTRCQLEWCYYAVGEELAWPVCKRCER